MNKSLSLLQIQEYIKQVLLLNFEKPVWVTAEISQATERRGNYYLSLIQKKEGSNDVIAQCQAILWARDFESIAHKRDRGLLQDVLQDGVTIQFLSKIEYHERYGLKLRIHDIDSTYSLGQFYLQQKEIRQRLAKEGLLQKNKELAAPLVYQRLAILSSAGAAGYGDFVRQLEDNPFRFNYAITLFDVAVQGKAVLQDFEDAMQQIAANPDRFDAIVVIRGGGSKMDISGFDSYEMGKLLAHAPLPVLSGIGHERDETIADLVAYQDFKTPTAVADFINHENAVFEATINQLWTEMVKIGNYRCEEQTRHLHQLETSLYYLASHAITREEQKLHTLVQQLKTQAHSATDITLRDVEKIAIQLDGLNPRNILERGYALVQKDNHPIHTRKDLPNTPFDIIFHDGRVVVKEIES